MSTKQIVDEIEKLPLDERLKLMQVMVMRIAREKEQSGGLSGGAKALLNDYENDKELTVFTLLDKESFYEAR
jgi:hypothetical protein